uniref:EOG090X0I2F n=1 Tax=Evadne anonyx TaxID=141404 RepID=A0A9N6ZGW6_9CRUS|nr:EOG090X0I2F [Evadne anonyx]
MRLLAILSCILFFISSCQALVWCYRCVSTHPGCGDKFDWRWHWSFTCPAANDRCVKVIEKKGADVVITRDCLSSLQGIRRDIPADVYEGCRPAASDVKLAQYVFNDISELDIKRNYYDNTTFCFCDFDHLCNSGGRAAPAAAFIATAAVLALAVRV